MQDARSLQKRQWPRLQPGIQGQLLPQVVSADKTTGQAWSHLSMAIWKGSSGPVSCESFECRSAAAREVAMVQHPKGNAAVSPS